MKLFIAFDIGAGKYIFVYTNSFMLGVQAREKYLLLHRYASFVAKNTTNLLLVLFFPAGTARAEDPAVSEANEAAEAVSAESEHRNGKH